MGLEKTKFFLYEIADTFQVSGQVKKIIPFGTGHIHDTYQVQTDEHSVYILQRMNHFVFKDIPGLMKNLKLVLDQLNRSISNYPRHLISTKNETSCFRDDDSFYWRLLNFIPDSVTYEQVESKAMAFSGGSAFGSFVAHLKDLSPALLVETIPEFHNLKNRIRNLKYALNHDVQGRSSTVLNEIEFVESVSDEMLQIQKLGESGSLSKRVIHNDTKINNVLFDSQGNAVCVIDLDTVMPGYLHFDFGDMLRTGAATALEDESDLSKVGVDTMLLENFTKGYLTETHAILNLKEIESLALAPAMMSFMMGVRFLTDYVEGDVYYKINYPEHNLVRAKNQFMLTKYFIEQQESIQKMINKVVR